MAEEFGKVPAVLAVLVMGSLNNTDSQALGDDELRRPTLPVLRGEYQVAETAGGGPRPLTIGPGATQAGQRPPAPGQAIFIRPEALADLTP